MDQNLLYMSVAPGILLMLFFYKKDVHEPEPVEKIRKVMLWGAASCLLALIAELALQAVFDSFTEPTSVTGVFLTAFLTAATVEELCKYLVVRKTIYKDPEFDEPYDGIVYCVAASLGFAIAENILYVLGGGFGVAIVRAVLAVPAHALFGVFLGYFMGLSKFVEPHRRRGYHLAGLAIAIFAHGTYDFVLMINIPTIQVIVLPLMGAFWILGLWKVKKLVAASPFIGQDLNPVPVPVLMDEVGSNAD